MIKVHLSFVVVLVLFSLQVQGSLSSHSSSQSNDNTLTLEERVALQKSTLHWYPFQRIKYHKLEDGTFEQLCPPPPGSSIDEFPQFFTRDQRLKGWITIHFCIAIYLFIILAFICDKYFLPCVERICEVLKISPDVAASTFMATATTMPEFFNNTISVFIAESDMGLGAIIGSMLFNTLGVAACASLFTKKPIQIDWWPITRDSILFSINISILVAFAWDGVIMWYETCVFVVLYIGYWVLMFQNKRIMKFVKGIVEDRFLWCQRIKNYDIINQKPFEKPTPATEENLENGEVVERNGKFDDGKRDSYRSSFENPGFEGSIQDISIIERIKARNRSKSFDINAFEAPANFRRERRQSFDLTRIDEIDEEEFKVWTIPQGASKFDLCWYFFTWPIRFLLHYTIPDPIRYKKWFVLSFFLCIVWIGCTSYLVFWMLVVIGDTFEIPEAVMGLTLMGFGGCMPEAISAIIVARKGSGQMGVSNALGANSLAILFSLGLPWFIRTMADGAGFNDARITIASEGIEFTILGLLLAVATLYTVISIAGYKFRKTVGGILGGCYLILVTIAVLLELDMFTESNNDC